MAESIDLHRLQNGLKQAIESLKRYGLRHDGKVSPIFSSEIKLPKVAAVISVDPDGRFFHLDYDTDDPIKEGVYNLGRLMDGLPTDSLVQCKECEKYVVDLSQKKKMFCTTACAARYNTRTKRAEMKDKHPRKYRQYLKRQREHMRSIRKGISSADPKKKG